MDRAQQLVEESEGCVLTAYRDSRELWTIGYGHLLEQSHNWTGFSITQQEADAYLEADMGYARVLATGFPHFEYMNDVRQAVCVSMCFQLGNKPLHWPNFMMALTDMDYPDAAKAGLDSLWHQQTPKRAEREMAMLESGTWINQGDANA